LRIAPAVADLTSSVLRGEGGVNFLVAAALDPSTLIARFDNGFVRFSEAFTDAERSLAECERLGLDGIVSKMGSQPYRSGKCDWSKTKAQAWLAANRNRAELFK
jgi:ATP-dependent DNA ligase